MESRKIFYQVFGLVLIVLMLAGCEEAPAESPSPPAPLEDTSEPAPLEDTSEPAPLEDTSEPAPLEDTSEPAPPEDTSEPADTETPAADSTPPVLSATEIPFNFSVGDFQLQITSVSLGASMFAPVGMAEDETVLSVKIEVLAGDPSVVADAEGDFDVWTADDTGRRNSVRAGAITVTADDEIRAIEWLFGVAESAESLYLHFPGGVTVDLSPLLS